MARFCDRFEAGLSKLAQGLTTACGEKHPGRIQERIGRLKASSRGAGQHYTVTLKTDDAKSQVTGLRWENTHDADRSRRKLLAQPHKHFEAISSRPLLMHGVATQTRHGGQTRLTITSAHAEQATIQAVLTSLAGFLATLKATAEQLTDAQRSRAILHRACAKFMRSTAGPPLQLASS